MPDTWTPPNAADTPTLYPSEPEPDASPWLTWAPAPDYWNTAPTMFLPPPKPAPPVPIPEGVFLIPTDLLPPPIMELAAPRAPSAIRPPPLLGVDDPPPSARAASVAPASAPAPKPAAAENSAAARDPLPVDLFPLDRCARLDAALALSPDAAPVLDAHKLDPMTWVALREHWQAAVRASLRDGDPTLLRAYDAAYVVELERVRGAITPEQHATLTRAAARGTRAEALAALGLPKAAVLHVERVMLCRAVGPS
ncbi:hypothetical protein [Polyangium spumosum]|uniref:Uncharacterized protein n=1 Tax=Polyangium spumosum TaxID=889282 RepID=A0A6N7QC61_9BACT|nr:hypothetical protein [Polyangium spumosum]MRG98461.1 hypothetical protein [Polyangium spumosum]